MKVRLVACATAFLLAVGLPTAVAKNRPKNGEDGTDRFWMCIETMVSPYGLCIPNLLDDLPINAD